ncbi:hypothetical protein TNCT_310961 [Trichonephila clavata]|uniref:Mutator-like transposase domain-containing protein n=1 Tax=Trichonephila clavata TaxID=2740835 RepID=A0A8X6HJC1_TRICU|nr:hypothetical protein TNCT_310961 [Trichonephila clavata]
MTSNSVPAGYEVNLRFVYGMRCIGIGKSAAQTFCALMNLPPPPAKFERLYTPIFNALETASSRSMGLRAAGIILLEERAISHVKAELLVWV